MAEAADVGFALGAGVAEAAPDVFGEGEGLVVIEADGAGPADVEAVTAVDGEADGSGVIEGVGDADFVAAEVGEVAGLGIATPLFHTSFLPLLMQVYFLPLAVAVVPAFLHASPAFTAAIAFMGTRKSARAINDPSTFFI